MMYDKITLNNINKLLEDIKQTHAFDSEYIKTHDITSFENIIKNTFLRHSPMIYLQNVNKESLGTSLYVRFRENKYIITVGHVFTGGQPVTLGEKPLGCPDLDKIYVGNGLKLVDFPRGMIIPPKEKDNFKELDYAIFQLSDSIEKRMDEVFRAFPLPDSNTADNFIPEKAFFCGYPAASNPGNRFANKTPNSLCLYSPLDYDFSLTHQSEHPNNIAYLFDFRKAATSIELKRGQTHTVCKLNGMSGCGIWSVPNFPIIKEESEYCLCGIFTSLIEEDGKKKLVGFTLNDIVSALSYFVDSSSKISQPGIHFSNS